MEVMSLTILGVVVAFVAIYAFVKIKLSTSDGMANYTYETTVDDNGNVVEKVIDTNETNNTSMEK